MNEFDRIDRFFRPLATHEAALGLRDDVALLSPKAGMQIILTTDAISQGIHFIGDEPPSEIARKLMRVNLSDIAAKGGVPIGYLLDIILPRDLTDEWFENFASGLARDQNEFGLSLLGGDTISTSGTPSFSMTMIGEVPNGKALLRGGAKVGDAIVVSGNLGEGAAGLLASRKKLSAISDIDAAYLISRYRLPQPRLAAGQAIQNIAHASMDISDGLMQDLGHMCKASGVGATVHLEAIPITASIRKLWLAGDMTTEDIVAGGDDYELLFAVPKDQFGVLADIARETKTPLTLIGEFTQNTNVELSRYGKQVVLSKLGYSHF
jgi:thiamine-monophosphate kinase